MNICLADLEKKIHLDAANQLLFFRDLIDFFISLKPQLDYKELGHINNGENRLYLSKTLLSFIKKYNIKKHTPTYEIFDKLHYLFLNYSDGGILSAYKSRETESWYPKIIIRQKIGMNSDLMNLDKEVIIYRGTSLSEYDSKKFSQSWTLEKEVAYKFAFTHYQNYKDYKNTIRVLIQAKINRENIYYFDKLDDEKEIIIDERYIKINSLMICDKKKGYVRIKGW